jgi:hypothetical protein
VHEKRTGRIPDLAAADAGFYSAKNEAEAKLQGVKRVSVPNRSTKSAERRRHQKQRWFKKGKSGEPDVKAESACSKAVRPRTRDQTGRNPLPARVGVASSRKRGKFRFCKSKKTMDRQACSLEGGMD